MNTRSIKAQLGIFLLLFSVYITFLEKHAGFLLAICISVIAAALVDSIVTYLKEKEFVLTESSIITGLIVSYVMAGSYAWWIIALTSVLAISSKHLIRFKTRHVFNPAGFGILAAVFLLGLSTEWKGAYLWYIIIPFGVYSSFKIKKLEIIISYFIASFILFGGQAIIQNAQIFDILGYLNYFFIFIMLIEPMTTPLTRFGKIIFGSGVGALVFILYAAGVKEPELFALTCFNLFTPLLNKSPSRQNM
ncbi:MAG: RnfABCDGE type electron transport complex subunit D [Candidatus Omnitrophota bacterium]|nr:RnfABCDGE type electron transport complex subunit D [Candidatus Omnitrophota bacterium]